MPGSNATHEHAMSQHAPHRKRRLRPQDPAIWVWAAVALIALLPLQHAVAARVERATTRIDTRATPAHPAATAPEAETAPGTATP